MRNKFQWQALILFILTIFIAQTAFAQKKPKPKDYGISSKKALGLYFDGIDERNLGHSTQAYEKLKKAIELEPQFNGALYLLANMYYQSGDFIQAKKYSEKLLDQNPEMFQRALFIYAECLYREEKFDQAVTYYKKFLEYTYYTPMDKMVAEITTKNAKFAKYMVEHPVEFDPKNLGGNINSTGDEYLPTITADGKTMFFTGRRTESTGGYQTSNMGGYGEDFYYSILDSNGNWLPAKNLGPPVNTDLNEGASCISPDGHTIYFTGCNWHGGRGKCDIYVAEFDGVNWYKPYNIGLKINTKYWDSQPAISPDGKTLYFSSNRPGGYGGLDIWYSEKIDGEWTEAKNLGQAVNSPGDEMSPFLHADGKTLYFSSNFHKGMGGADLFLSEKIPNGWTLPKNLGYPINTIGDERYIFVSTNGLDAYYSSNQKGGFGKFDIFKFKMPEEIRPSFTTYVKGTVVDSISNKPISANVLLVNLSTNDTLRDVYSDKLGKFLVTLPSGNDYATFVSKDGYLFYNSNFYVDSISSEVFYDLLIKLKPIKKGESVVLENIFYETDKFKLLPKSKAGLDYLLGFLNKNPKLAIEIQGHTDNVGTKEYNLNLSEKRAQEVVKYLIEKGIDPKRLQAKGYGMSQAIATNETEKGRAKNRRTAFKVLGNLK